MISGPLRIRAERGKRWVPGFLGPSSESPSRQLVPGSTIKEGVTWTPPSRRADDGPSSGAERGASSRTWWPSLHGSRACSGACGSEGYMWASWFPALNAYREMMEVKLWKIGPVPTGGQGAAAFPQLNAPEVPSEPALPIDFSTPPGYAFHPLLVARTSRVLRLLRDP